MFYINRKNLTAFYMRCIKIPYGFACSSHKCLSMLAHMYEKVSFSSFPRCSFVICNYWNISIWSRVYCTALIHRHWYMHAVLIYLPLFILTAAISRFFIHINFLLMPSLSWMWKNVTTCNKNSIQSVVHTHI